MLRAYLEQGCAREIVEGCPLFVSDAVDLGMAGAAAMAREVLLDEHRKTFNVQA